MKGFWILSKSFPYLMRYHWLFSFRASIWWITSIHLHMLNHPCISVIEIYLIMLVDLFDLVFSLEVLLRTFATMFIRKIGVYFFSLLVLYGLYIRLTVASKKELGSRVVVVQAFNPSTREA